MELTDEQKSLLSEARRDPKIWDVIEGSISDGESTSAKWGDRIAGVQSEVVMDQVYKAMASDPATLTDSSADSHYDVSTDGQALDSDGNAITIKGVSSIEKGKMVLETEDGAVDASGVSYASTGDALVYEAVASLGGIIDAETANKLLKRYDGSTDAKVFARGVVQAYTYGFYGYDRSETMGIHTMSAELTREQRNTAYGLGQLYRQKATQAKQAELEKRKTEAKESGGKGSVMFWGKEGATDFRTATEGMALNGMQETAVATMEKLSAALGINFYVYQSYAKNGTRYYIDKDGVERKNSPNGYYAPATGSIYIDLHAGQDARGTMLFTVAHELTHYIHQWSPAKFKKLAEILFAQEGMKGNVAKLVARKQAQAKGRGKPISYAVAYEEVVADAMESILTSGNVVQFMADVKRQDRSLWKKICDWFKNLADDLKALINAYKDVSPDSVEGKAVAAMGDVVSELEKIFAEGLVDAAENHQAVGAQKNTTDDGGVDHDAAVKNSDRIVDQIRSSLTKIMALDSVYTIDSSNATPYTSDWKTDEKSGHEVFKSQGSAAYRPGFGKVILSKKGAVQSLYHGNGPAKQAVFPAIKAVIEQGIEIGRDYNHNNQGFDTVTFSAPIDFFGDKSPLAVVVKVYESRNADKTFYIHEICDSEGNYICMAGEDPPKKSSSTNLVDPTSTVSAADGGNTSKNSIRNDGGIVKADIRYSHRPGDGFEEHDIISAVYGIRNEAARRGHDLVKIGTMPVIYQNLFGLSGDVFVSNEHLYQNMVSRATAEAEGRFKAGTQADYHELGEETVVEAIEQFQNPIAIMESLKDYKEPRLVAILDEKGNDGQNLIAVMRLYADLTSPDTNHPRNHVLLTIYEKRSLPNYIELTAEKNRVLHIRKGVSKKTVADLQLVGTEFKETLKRNVARFNAKVKDFKKTNGIFYSERRGLSYVVFSPEQVKNVDNLNPTENADIRYQARQSQKDPSLLDPRTVTRDDVVEILHNVINGTYHGNTYVPVRISTPGIVQERLFTDDLPIIMPVSKIAQALAKDNGPVKGKNIRGHGFSVGDVMDIIERMDSPDFIYSQDDGRGVEIIKLSEEPNSTAVIVEFHNNVNKAYMNGYEGGAYNVSITMFNIDGGNVGLFMYSRENGWHEVFNKQKEGDPAKKFPATRPFAVEQDSLTDMVAQPVPEVKHDPDGTGGTLNSDRVVTEIPNREYVALYNHFGSTKNYDVAGYILKNGIMLDFSGKHWGDTHSTIRQVDHRDIWDAWQHEDRDGTDEMVNLIGNGNIRLMPETGGVNLAVMPNAAQINVLRGYINHFRGEIIVDIDRVGGDTIRSFEYSRGTSSSKIIADIKAYFDSGTIPAQQSSIREFLYQERSGDSMSDRAIFAEALRSTLKHGEKSKTVADYLDSFERISAAEQRLAEINAEIQRINSTKGKKDTGRLRQLRDEAIVLKNNMVDGG